MDHRIRRTKPSTVHALTSTQGSGPGLLSVVVKGTRTAAGTGAFNTKISIDMAFRSGSGNGGFRPGAYMGYGGRGV